MVSHIGISLGWNCHSALHGVNIGIRTRKKDGYNTCPFDKMLSNFDGVVECIKDDFAYFTDDKHLSINATNPADPTIVNLKYRFAFNHESPGHANLYITERWPEGINHFTHNKYKNFKIRFQNRINNFRNYLSDPNNHITFIVTSWDKTEEDMKPLRDVLATRYPNLSYNFVIWNDHNGKEYFLRHMRDLGLKDDEHEVKRLLPPPSEPKLTIIKNIVIGLHLPFGQGGGGCVVQAHLANLLRNRGFNVRLLTAWIRPPQLVLPNFVFAHAATDKPNDIDVSSNDTIVIYCEGVEGNPFNGKNVVRWMLSELGKNVPHSFMYSWRKHEIVYYFNGEPKHVREPSKMGNIFKLLSLLYFNPNVKQYNYQPRNKECHTFRKTGYHVGLYHKQVYRIHSGHSTLIDFDNNHDRTISIFNEHDCFYCYDPLTWLAFMAPVCGCYTIVHPVAGQDKRTWLSNTALSRYMIENNVQDIYGIGYGLNEREYAKSTLHLAKQQWDDMQHYFNVTCLDRFIEDIGHFRDLKNRVGNNFS
jgi:hypothetical protein